MSKLFSLRKFMRGRPLALSLQSSPAHTMRNQRDADGSDKLVIKTIREPPGQLKVIWSPCGEETDDKVEERFIGTPLSFSHIAWEGQCPLRCFWRDTSACWPVNQGRQDQKTSLRGATMGGLESQAFLQASQFHEGQIITTEGIYVFLQAQTYRLFHQRFFSLR